MRPSRQPKVALVTGAASGIGRALAEALAVRGDTVVLLDLDPAVVAVAAALPGPAEGVVADVRDAAAVDAVVADVWGRRGGIDLLVNNAGVTCPGDLAETSLEQWTDVLDVNVRGALHTLASCYPRMVARGSGQVANVASVAGLVPGPLNAPYAMTKHALVGLSLSLRSEAADRGVRVSVVCPSAVHTPLLGEVPATSWHHGRPLPPLWQRRVGWLTMGLPGRPATAEQTAQDVLAGLAQDRAVIATGHARSAVLLQRLSPALTQWGARTLARTNRG